MYQTGGGGVVRVDLPEFRIIDNWQDLKMTDGWTPFNIQKMFTLNYFWEFQNQKEIDKIDNFPLTADPQHNFI